MKHNAAHHCYPFPRPSLTVDVVLLRERAGEGEVLLIRRRRPPFQGHWALPGGFVDKLEPLEDAARRELQEETHLEVGELRQVGAFGAPGRDPRGWTVSVAFVACAQDAAEAAAHDAALQADDDADDAAWWPLANLPTLAFDHAHIIQCATSKTIR